MLLTYQECVGKYGSDYRLKKEIASGNLFLKEKGIYSTMRNTSEIEVLLRKYPKAVCTGKSAFYYHSLTDVIPEHYYLATRRTDTRIGDARVIQSFLKEEIFEPGIIEMKYNNAEVKRQFFCLEICLLNWILAWLKIMHPCSVAVKN